MKRTYMRKDKRSAIARVLAVLALSEVNHSDPMSLNKYQIEKETKIRRETVYDIIEGFKRDEIIQVVKKVITRTGQESERYLLTERGFYKAAILNPDLEKKIAARLGDKFRVIQENTQENAMNDRLDDLAEWVEMARNHSQVRQDSTIRGNEHGDLRRCAWTCWISSIVRSMGDRQEKERQTAQTIDGPNPIDGWCAATLQLIGAKSTDLHAHRCSRWKGVNRGKCTPFRPAFALTILVTEVNSDCVMATNSFPTCVCALINKPVRTMELLQIFIWSLHFGRVVRMVQLIIASGLGD